MLVEDLGMTGNQRQTLIAHIKTFGDNDATQPAHRNHWRQRLDNKAMIFEAKFAKNNLTIQKFKDKLAEIFSVDVATVGHTGTNPVTFNRGGDKLLVQLFAGLNTDWETSRQACLAYLSDNLTDWESPEL